MYVLCMGYVSTEIVTPPYFTRYYSKYFYRQILKVDAGWSKTIGFDSVAENLKSDLACICYVLTRMCFMNNYIQASRL